jgi:predicted HD phosphohydrolase
MEVYGRKDHESVAADWLRERGFSEKTAILVENHVNAKRYLTFIDEDYFEALSEASKQTLIFQGGRMTEIEAKEFEQNPYFELIIKMRRWDEAAKVEAMKLPTLDHFLNIIDIYLTNK